jgi:hypothetical protein
MTDLITFVAFWALVLVPCVIAMYTPLDRAADAN